ncbi:MAG: hypothetical protein LBF77_11685, partial [Spirochaetaceae bacterium]|nr:hypothetical protein [Spirochaetaceae bacterium]
FNRLFHPNYTENTGKIPIIEARFRVVRVKAGALPGINPEIKVRHAWFGWFGVIAIKCKIAVLPAARYFYW